MPIWIPLLAGMVKSKSTSHVHACDHLLLYGKGSCSEVDLYGGLMSYSSPLLFCLSVYTLKHVFVELAPVAES